MNLAGKIKLHADEPLRSTIPKNTRFPPQKTPWHPKGYIFLDGWFSNLCLPESIQIWHAQSSAKLIHNRNMSTCITTPELWASNQGGKLQWFDIPNKASSVHYFLCLHHTGTSPVNYIFFQVHRLKSSLNPTTLYPTYKGRSSSWNCTL